jgi:glutamine---fructose-6-phosphate transaminase (isomerizing)
VTTFIDVVRAQPEILARSAATVRTGLADGRLVKLLRGGRLLAFGMGASRHAATAFAATLRAAGWSAFAASACDVTGPPGLADRYLAVSHSGRSRETVEAAAALGGPYRVGLTSHPDAPLGGAVDAVLTLGCDTDSRVSTASYTATVQALGMLAGALGADCPDLNWDLVPELAAAMLTQDLSSTVDILAGVSTVDVVGTGRHAGCAGAAALLLREAVRLPATAYTAREYLHGPVEAAGPGRAVLVFHDGRLLPPLLDHGARAVLLTNFVGEYTGGEIVRMPAWQGLAGCVIEAIAVQLLAYGLAERKGITIDLRHVPDDTKLAAP